MTIRLFSDIQRLILNQILINIMIMILITWIVYSLPGGSSQGQGFILIQL